MFECVVEHRGNHGSDTTRKEAWLRTASEIRYQSVENFKRFDVAKSSYMPTRNAS